ncbi:gliding motility-associated C-terminal domain-containing protein [Rufibacter sp. LB8]|uniref:gliding motility-associated C-terminal domain-containing protein n=1 Tax=Rufibacter sp. LB8 TaxID=2777781 RepID=UPI00178C36BD|nr:gliding motility-associated C-terminal domain-containing protein [Rufibacter sp. LB8]
MSHLKRTYLILLLLFICSSASFAQNCVDAPDARLEDADGANFINCSSSVGNKDYVLTVNNISSTQATNQSYVIDWGDNSSNTYPASFTTASHTYKTQGKFTLKLTVKSASGCLETTSYTVFSGSNPGIGLASPGNTSDCAPAVFTFKITNTENNSPTTTYKIWFDDGTPPRYFTQATLRDTISHVFAISSKGTTNGFSMYAEASNECLTTPARISGIIVSTKPVAGFSFGPGSPLCVNQKVDFKDTSTGGFNGNNPNNSGSYRRNWSITPSTGWSYSTGNATSEQPSIIFHQAGVYVMKLAVTPLGSNPSCQGDEITKTILVQEPTQAAFNLLPDKTDGCAPNLVRTENLTPGTFVNYNWTISPAEGVTFASGTATSANPEFLFSASGKYTVTLTATNACGVTTANREIVIRDKPVVSLPAAASYCGPQTISFSAANAAHAPVFDAQGGTIIRYLWTLPAGADARFENPAMADQANPTILFTQPGVYEVKAQVWNECGASSTATQTITINALPLAPTVASALICQGTTATLEAQGNGSTYRWFASPTATTALFTGQTFTTPALSATTTYYVEAVSANDCVSSARTAVTVTVQPLPAAPIAADVTACANTTVTLRATVTSGVATWFAEPTGGTALGTGETFITPGLTTTTTYYVAAITPEGCASPSRTAVKVTVQPAIAGNTIGQAHTLCMGGTATALTGTPLTGGTGSFSYLWESSLDGTTFANAAGSRTSANYSPGKITQTTWYRRRVTSGTCVSFSNVVKVSVVPPVANNTILTPDLVICSGTAPMRLQGEVPSGGNGGTPTYLWEMSTTSATSGFTTATGTSTGVSYQPATLTKTTWYRRKVTIDGCMDVSQAIAVSVNPLSLPPTAASATICSGTTATLTATAPGGPYEWYTAATGGTLLHTGDAFTTPALTTTTSYYVQSTATGGCTVARTQVKVTVQAPIATNTISQTQEICEGATPTALTGTKPVGGNGVPVYLWEISTDGQTYSTAPGISNGQHYAPAALTATTWFRRKVTMGACTAYSNEIKIGVTPSIAPITMPADLSVCAGSPVPALSFGDASGGTGTFTYKWEKSTTSATTGFTDATGSFRNATYAPGVISTTTWYRRITYSGSCQLTSGAMKVTVLPLPTVPTAAVANTTICQGTSTVVTATPANSDYQVQWFDAATGGTLLHEGNAYTTPALTTNTAYYAQTVALSGCPSATRVAVKVTVNPVITNNTVPTGHTICAGATSPQLVGSVPSGGTGTFVYAWEMSTTSASTGFGPITGIISTQVNFNPGTLTQTTWYRRKVTSGACSDYSEAVKVEVQPAIEQNTISAEQSICAGETPATLVGTLPVGGTGDFTYIWEMSTNSATSGFTVIPNADGKDFAPAALTKDTWFRRKVTSGACANVISNVVKVSVAQLPANPVVQAATVCHAERVTLVVKSPVTGVTYQWFEAATGGSALAAGTSFTTGNLTQSVIYYAQALAGSGCTSARIAVAVTVQEPLGNNSLSQNQQVCAGTAAVLLTGSTPTGGSSTYTYQWESSQDGVNFIIASGSSQGINYNPGTLYQTMWYRRVVKSGGCVPLVSAPVKVLVNPPMSNNFITADQVIYGNTRPAPFSGTTPSGGDGAYVYEWQSSTDGRTFTSIDTNGATRTYTSSPLTQTTWFRRMVLSGGCQNISNVVKVTVSELVSQNTITADQNICAGAAPETLLGSSPLGGDGTFNYGWEISTTSATAGFTTAPGTADDMHYTPGVLNQTTWFRRKVSSGSSTLVSNIVKVTVVKALAQNTVSGEQTVCVGSAPARLIGSLPTGGTGTFTYVWEMSTTNETAGFITATGTNTEQHYTPGALVRTTWFRRKVLSGGCNVSESNTIQVTATPLPVAPSAMNQVICAGNSATVVASGTTAGAVVEWYDQATGGRLLHSGTSYTTPALTASTMVYMQAVAQNCASERVAVQLTVPGATANAGADATIETGQSVELRASGGVTYQWSPTTGLSSDKIANPVATPTKTITYKVTVTTADGCTSTDEVVVNVLDPIKVHNGFTPNGDTFNDTWEIPELKDYPSCTVEVYNRWGNKVFESKGYTQPWDGRTNGQALPAATYYYIIKLDGKERILSGNVTIIK